jgi:hypothetical protein
MAATAPDTTIDPALARVALSTAVHACSSAPANHAGIAAVTLGNYTLTAGTGGGDWTIANGDTSGRKLTLGAQSGNNGTGTGVANFLAFTDGTTLHFVADADGETINSGSPWTIGALDVWEIADPS